MDVSIASVALPFISNGLGVTAARSVWAINAFQIAIVIALLPMAKASQILGYKKVYLAGILLFMLAASGSILATSLPVLAISRFVQGIGAAAVMVVSGALVRTIYPPEFIPRGIGYNTIAVSIASAAGPAVGALVLSLASWHAVFAVGLPFGLLSLVIGIWAIPSTAAARQPFERSSALLSAVGFAAIFLALNDFARIPSQAGHCLKSVSRSQPFFSSENAPPPARIRWCLWIC